MVEHKYLTINHHRIPLTMEKVPVTKEQIDTLSDNLTDIDDKSKTRMLDEFKNLNYYHWSANIKDIINQNNANNEHEYREEVLLQLHVHLDGDYSSDNDKFTVINDNPTEGLSILKTNLKTIYNYLYPKPKPTVSVNKRNKKGKSKSKKKD